MFELFNLVLQKYTTKQIAIKLSIAEGTVKRWIKLKSVPKQFQFDFYNLLEINVDYNDFSFKEKDQFYTPDYIVDKCLNTFYDILKEYKIDINDYLFIEPSAGDGSFYKKLPNNKIGFDIEPRFEGIIKQDWFKYKANQPTIVIGNPPFGLRGNLALRFINHAAFYGNADFVAFILPPFFNSDGKGNCKSRVKGLNCIHSENLEVDFYYPNFEKVTVNTVFQVWAKNFGKKSINIKCDGIKLYSVSNGETSAQIRNKKMHNKCDFYLPSTCFGKNNMKLYYSFNDLPNQRGIGIKVLDDKYNKIIKNINWENISFISTNGAYNLRFNLINNAINNEKTNL